MTHYRLEAFAKALEAFRTTPEGTPGRERTLVAATELACDMIENQSIGFSRRLMKMIRETSLEELGVKID